MKQKVRNADQMKERIKSLRRAVTGVTVAEECHPLVCNSLGLKMIADGS